MTAEAAAPLGLRIAVLDPDLLCPASAVARVVAGQWQDGATLAEFARDCGAVTLENEFIDATKLAALENAGVRVVPSARTVALVQDKLIQKQTFAAAGLPLPDFVAFDPAKPDSAAIFGFPALLKARRNGYDGRGNVTLRSAADIEAAMTHLGAPSRELLIERFVPFTKELAVMVGRGQDGATVLYPVVETVQKDHICHTVVAPADVSEAVARRAAEIAQQAVEAIGGVGIFGVELFLLDDGMVLVNEIAPRPHNSGHYTIEACVTSQYENHIRAVLGWPLGAPDLRSPAAMVNLLGERDGAAHPSGYAAALAVPDAHVHIYGKAQVRRGRKMGHVTALAPPPADALARAQEAAAHIEL